MFCYASSKHKGWSVVIIFIISFERLGSLNNPKMKTIHTNTFVPLGNISHFVTQFCLVTFPHLYFSFQWSTTTVNGVHSFVWK